MEKKTYKNKDNNIFKVSADNKTLEQRYPGGARVWRRNGPGPTAVKFMPPLGVETHPLAGTKWSYGAGGVYMMEFLRDGTVRYFRNGNPTLFRWSVVDAGTVKAEQGASLFGISADGQLLSQITEDKVTAWRRIGAPSALSSVSSAARVNAQFLGTHLIADTQWEAALNKNATLHFLANGSLLFKENLRRSEGKWDIVNPGTVKDEKEIVFYLSANKKFLTQVAGAKAFLWLLQPNSGESAPPPVRAAAANVKRGAHEEYEALEQAYANFFSEKMKPVNQRDARSLDSLKKSIGENDIHFLKNLGEAVNAVAQDKLIDAMPEAKPGKTLTSLERKLWNIKIDREKAMASIAHRRGLQFKQPYEKLLKRALEENNIELAVKIKRRVNYISLPPNPFGGVWQLNSPKHTWTFFFNPNSAIGNWFEKKVLPKDFIVNVLVDETKQRRLEQNFHA